MKNNRSRNYKEREDKSYSGFVRVRTQDEALEILALEDKLVLVERGEPRSLKLRCPCGDGHVVTVNLDPTVGLAWRLRVAGSSLSLSPSVWLETGCRCHFILRRNKIFALSHGVKSSRRRAPESFFRDF
jgi:Family of unknown function (DUF6527)